MREIWKPVPNWQYYEVSNFGRVRRLASIVSARSGGTRYIPERINTGGIDSDGYRQVQLSLGGRSGRKKIWLVHRLVMFVFKGASKLTVNHKDGNKLNNHITNLEYATRSKQMYHAYQLGLKKKDARHLTGSRHPLSKLNEDNVKFILKNKGELSAKELAITFGVHQNIIYPIWNRQSWKHVQV